MSTHGRKESWIILLLLGLLLAARDCGAATAEESLAKINHLAPAERQAEQGKIRAIVIFRIRNILVRVINGWVLRTNEAAARPAAKSL